MKFRLALAVGALIALTAGSAQAATPPVVLAGFTSQSYPSFFKVSGRSLAVGSIALRMQCTSGAVFAVPDRFARVPIGPKGKFHEATGSTTTSDGVTYTATDTLTGSVNGAHSKLTGTWHLAIDYATSGGQTDRCDSGQVRFADTR